MVVQHIEPAHVCVCMLLLFIIFLFSYQCISLYAFDFFFVCKAIVVCVRHLFSFGHAAHSKVIILIEHGSREIQPSQVGAWNMGSLSMMAFFSAARRLSRSLTCNFVFFSFSLFFKRYGEPLAKMATSLFFNWKNR